MSSTRKSVKDDSKVEKKEAKSLYEKKKELKLKGDLGYDCTYYNWVQTFSKGPNAAKERREGES